MKKILLVNLIFFISIMISGCSTPDTSYYLYDGYSYSSDDFSISIIDSYFEDNKVIYEIEYVNYRSSLRDLVITNIMFSYNNIGYDYLQIREYDMEDIYVVSVNDVITDLSSYNFTPDVTYSIEITINFDIFLDDHLDLNTSSDFDYKTVELYIDVKGTHFRLLTKTAV